MITLTDTAATKVRQLIDAEGDEALALRVAVRPGGCSGFAYEMFFDTDVATDDITTEFDGVRVVVDPSSAQLLNGASSTTRTASSSGFSITTRTPSAPAAAASRSAERSARLREAVERGLELDAVIDVVETLDEGRVGVGEEERRLVGQGVGVDGVGRRSPPGRCRAWRRRCRPPRAIATGCPDSAAPARAAGRATDRTRRPGRTEVWR